MVVGRFPSASVPRLRLNQLPESLPTVLLTERMSAAGKPQEFSDKAISAHANQRKRRFMGGRMRRRADESSGR
jgi:hypothetical protein